MLHINISINITKEQLKSAAFLVAIVFVIFLIGKGFVYLGEQDDRSRLFEARIKIIAACYQGGNKDCDKIWKDVKLEN